MAKPKRRGGFSTLKADAARGVGKPPPKSKPVPKKQPASSGGPGPVYRSAPTPVTAPLTSAEQAVIWAAENTLAPASVIGGVYPTAGGAYTPPPGLTPAERNYIDRQRLNLALQTPVSPTAGVLLAAMMTPARRASLIRPLLRPGPALPPQGLAENAIAQGRPGYVPPPVYGPGRIGNALLHTVLPAAIHAAPSVAKAIVRAPPSIDISPHGLSADAGGAARRAVGAGEGLAVAAQQATEAAGYGLGKLAAGTAGELARGKIAIGRSLGQQPSSADIAIAQRGSAMGVAPQAALPVLAKVAAGGAGSVVAFRHPGKALANITKGGITSLVAFGQLFGLGVEMTDPNTSWGQKAHLLSEPMVGLLKQLQQMYGPNVTVGDAFRAAQEDPFNYGSNFLALLAPGARVAEIAFGIGEGMTLEEAIAAARTPTVDRTLRLRTEGGGVKHVTIPQSQSPLYRHAVSAPYDLVSKALSASPGLRRLPIAEVPRAARAQSRIMRRQLHRLPAPVQAAFRDVTNFLGQSGNKHYAAALDILLQKPKGFTDDEWLKASLENMRTMLESGEFSLPDGKLSPGVQRLVNQIRRAESKAEDAQTKRRSRASHRVADEQDRLSKSLNELVVQQRGLRQERRDMLADESKSEAERAENAKLYDQQLRAIDSQMKVARGELDDLSVDQQTVESPKRDQAQALMESLPYFQENPEAVDDVLRIGDAQARAWAAAKGLDPGEWWNRHDFTGDIADLPQDASIFHQIRDDGLREPHGQTSPFRPSDDAMRINRNNAARARAGRRGEPTYQHVHPNGVVKAGKVGPEHGLQFANPPTFDANGRLLFGGEVPFHDLISKWEEGFQRDFAGETDAQVRQRMLDAADFYEKNVFPYLGRILNDREVQAWLASQVGASPGRGLMDLAKIIEHGKLKEEIGPDDIGLAAQAMARILYGQRDLSRGAAAKISDFTDNGHGAITGRTYLGTQPGGPYEAEAAALGNPYTVDRWETRANGRVDPQIIEKFYADHDAALQKQGYISHDEWSQLRKQASDEATAWYEREKKRFKDGKTKDEPTINQRDGERDRRLKALEARWERQNRGRRVIKSDLAGAPNATQYEHVSDYGNELVDHLNETKYLGKEDWNVSSTQALNWAGVQRHFGANPENLDTAIFSQEAGVAFHPITPGLVKKFPEIAQLTKAGKLAFGRYITDSIIDVAAQRAGVVPTRTTLGYGGWKIELTDDPTVRSGVLAGPRAFNAFIDNVRELSRGDEAWGARGNSKGKQAQLTITAPGMKVREARKLQLALARAHPELHGFDPLPGGGFSAIFAPGGDAASIGASLQREIEATMETLSAGHRVDVKAKWTKLDAVRSTKEEPALGRYLGEQPGGLGQPAAGAELRRGGPDARVPEDRLRATAADRRAVDAKVREALDLYRQEGEAGLEKRGGLAGRLDDPLARPHISHFGGKKPGQLIETPVKWSEKTGEPTKFRLTLAQSRQSDIKGATALLEGPDGRRIIYLSRNADVSTVLHELVGHAADEMHELYPREFAEVETYVGKPYADWTVDDHERFANWAERYFDSGFAPTPELARTFQRMKTWMRAVYVGMRGELGDQLPHQTRALFDTYFGAYDDQNVARIAMNMGREGWGAEDGTRERWGSVAAVAKDDLRALKKRNETRRYNRSLDGMVNRLDEMTKRLDMMKKKQPDWTDADYEEYQRLSAEITVNQAEIIVRKDLREKNLRAKISDLEKALEGGIDKPGFAGALGAMKWIADDRERILREVFGDRYDEVFSNRVDLLADWLVSHDLLQPDYEHGTGTYYPMTMDVPTLQRVAQPAASLVSRVVGKTKTDQLKLHKKNNMILWQRGDWQADPAVLLEANLRAQSYNWMLQVKNLLYEVGRPLTYEEAQNLPRDVYLLNPSGTPIGPGLRNQLRGASSTEDAHQISDALEGGDNDTLESSLKRYWDAFAIDPNHLPEGFKADEIPDLRVVDKRIVETILRPLRPGRSRGGKIWDDATTMARFALIYANVPGYMLTNATGNLGLLLAQQGWRLPASVASARHLLRNDKLRDYVMAETGDLPLQAIVSRGRDFDYGTAARAVEGKFQNFAGVVDRYPRMIAWVYEAKKRGYKSEADMIRLVEGKDAKTLRDREIVSDRATNHMVDFDRLSNYERQAITRVLFIWPYVRGATAWPFWYAKNFPERAAIGAQLANVMAERQQEMLADPNDPNAPAFPSWYHDIYPVSRSGDQAQIIRTSTLSPTSMAGDIAQSLYDTVASLLGKQPDSQTMALIDHFAPLIRSSVEAATLRNNFGQEQSIRSTFGQDVLAMVPGYRLVKAIIDPSVTPRPLRKHDRGLQDRVLRTFVRINPQTFTVSWLNAQAQVIGTKTTSEKIADANERANEQWKKVDKQHPLPMAISRALAMKVVYEDGLAALSRAQEHDNPDFVPHKVEDSGLWSTHYTPTPYDRAQQAWGVLQKYLHPDGMKGIPSPDDILTLTKVKPNTPLGDLYMERWLHQVWENKTASANRLAATARRLKKGKAIVKQEKARSGGP